MAMFISKTLTTAIIRYNTGATLQKPPLQSLGIGNLPNANVGVVKPLNIGGMVGPGAFGESNTGYYNNPTAQSFQQSWNMGLKGMEMGKHSRGGDDMTGFRAAASAAGFHIR